MKAFLGRLINEQDELGRRFAALIQIMVVASILGFALMTLPDLPEPAKGFLWLIQYFVLGMFTAEYLLRIYLTEDRMGYLFSGYGLIDLLAIAPFYVAGLADFTSVRALRVFRLLRLLKFARYARAVERLAATWEAVKAELILVILAATILMYLASVGIYFFEHDAQPQVFSSVPQSFWWSLVTLFTVGYGDMVPITTGGKIFASFIILIGVGLVTTPAGLIAAGVIETRASSGARGS